MSRSSSSFTLAVFLFLAFFTIFTSAAPVRGHYGRQSEPASPAPSSSPSDSTGGNSNDNTSSGGSTSTTSGATYSGTVRPIHTWRFMHMSWHVLNTPLCPQATWFDVGLGACGKTNVNTDFIVALPTPDYDGGANCGRVRSTPFLRDLTVPLTSSHYHSCSKSESPTQRTRTPKPPPSPTCALDAQKVTLVRLVFHCPPH